MRFTQADGTIAEVHFDGVTHASGRARAFIGCTRHRRCRLYRYMDVFASERACVAHLLAWHMQGNLIEDPAKACDHRAMEVPDAVVQDVAARLQAEGLA